MCSPLSCLGPTNPNSPSFSNLAATPKLTSQNHIQRQQIPLRINLPAAKKNSSSSLLSLHPPISRSQSLLLQMASLASKLFEVSRNRASGFTSFRGLLPTFLDSQTQTLSPPPLETSPTSPKEIISLFTSLQTQLFESLEAKQKITLEIKKKDAAILSFAKKLKEDEHFFDLLVDDYSDYHRPKRSKTEGHRNSEDTKISYIPTLLKLNDILSYSHNISYTTFAPHEFGTGQAPLRGALPPAPQEEKMPVEGLVPPHLTVPLGERPGKIPVELPTDFPVMRPDVLKLGDPDPMPALDALVRDKVELQQPRHVAQMPVQRLEPRQVPFLQLDIDQGDCSSEYSSEESSEED
ncbi:hypothetical protein MKX03_024140 [Papaver bracteatum]|nr:hypothetical protein MKX03_024140 [Papaver bracteatum]